MGGSHLAAVRPGDTHPRVIEAGRLTRDAAQGWRFGYDGEATEGEPVHIRSMKLPPLIHNFTDCNQ
jgi:hypothetical protein